MVNYLINLFIFSQIVYNIKKQIASKEKYSRYYQKHFRTYFILVRTLFILDHFMDISTSCYNFCGFVLAFYNFKRSRFTRCMTRRAREYYPCIYNTGNTLNVHLKKRKNAATYFACVFYLIFWYKVYSIASYSFFNLFLLSKRSYVFFTKKQGSK